MGGTTGADFDQDETDRYVRQAVGEVPASVRMLLDLTAGGVKLTPGGRLPRALVRQVQEQRPQWYPLDRPASIEEDLLPLAVLHDLMRSVGLLRLARECSPRPRPPATTSRSCDGCGRGSSPAPSRGR